jgi:hypothetical protein
MNSNINSLGDIHSISQIDLTAVCGISSRIPIEMIVVLPPPPKDRRKHQHIPISPEDTLHKLKSDQRAKYMSIVNVFSSADYS